MYTREQIQTAVESKGYRWFISGDYNLNIVGVRNMETGVRVTNKFDDKLTVSYMEEGAWKFFCWDCTTDPGDDWMDNPMSPSKGCAILVPGQYRGSHKIRLHGGRYTALGQKSPVKVYRDRDKDGKYDFDESTIDEGVFGINIHRATARKGQKSTYIDKWSAGCQVIAANEDFQTFMKICHRAKRIWGNSFTYTLIESRDIL